MSTFLSFSHTVGAHLGLGVFSPSSQDYLVEVWGEMGRETGAGGGREYIGERWRVWREAIRKSKDVEVKKTLKLKEAR
jgi:hypothetical protein